MEANCGLLAGACCSVFIGCISHRAPRDSGSNLDYTELGASFCCSGALIRRFLAVLLAIIAWQAIYCLGVTDGKLTGLFVIGSGQPRPPELEARVFVHPNSTGYDGQISRVVARDPLLRNGHWRLIDGARYR